MRLQLPTLFFGIRDKVTDADLAKSIRKSMSGYRHFCNYCKPVEGFGEQVVCNSVCKKGLGNLKPDLQFRVRGDHCYWLKLKFSQWISVTTTQRAPNPPEFAQPRLSRVKRRSPARGYTFFCVFVPIWLVLRRCEATNLGVFVPCRFALISPYSNGAVQIRVGLELAELQLQMPTWILLNYPLFSIITSIL